VCLCVSVCVRVCVYNIDISIYLSTYIYRSVFYKALRFLEGLGDCNKLLLTLQHLSYHPRVLSHHIALAW
jgi:hypothetical protein